jgi:hypothetical protein
LTIISCLETVCHACEEWNDMRFRKSQFSWHILRESDDEQSLIHCECSIARSLNFVAEIVNCRSLISHVLVSELISHKTTYNDTNEFFLLLVCSIQETDALVQAWKAKAVKKSAVVELKIWDEHLI